MIEKEVDNTWYLVPLLFGLLGGIIAYVATKDDDNEKAVSFIMFGAIISGFTFLFGLMWMLS